MEGGFYCPAMGALDGLKVLDLSIIVQGPQAGQMLHDMGADVVKVELPGAGDLARWIPVSADDPRSGYFVACNRGKRSVTLDLRTAGGTRALERLAATADVLLAAPVNDYTHVVADAQAWANGYFAKAQHPEWGEITTVGFPIRFSATPAIPGVVTPELGQHTEEVLLEAGFTWEELEELRAAGAW